MWVPLGFFCLFHFVLLDWSVWADFEVAPPSKVSLERGWFGSSRLRFILESEFDKTKEDGLCFSYL